MDSVNLEKKFKIKGESFSLKEILMHVPTRYEKKIFLEEEEKMVPNIFYKFIFYPKDIVRINHKITMRGEAAGRKIKVIHSAKLFKFFNSQHCLSFCGQFENDTCFFPELLKTISRTNEICPVYRGFSSLVSKHIREAVDCLPAAVKGLFQSIHFPENIEEVRYSLNQLLIYEVAIFFQIVQQLQKPRPPYEIFPIKSPFVLTEDQNKVWENILTDCRMDHRFIRVIHGEVGSGKTLLAYLAATLVAKNGKKVALMAPTGILAKQIYNFFIENNHENFAIGLVVHHTAKNKKSFELLSKNDIFIGTHALLYKSYVENLGLFIIDEQHRFGVNQRNSLLGNSNADVLMLTATAIPRTYQMMSKGYIEFSQIKGLPTEGTRKTMIISEKKMDEVFKKMFFLSASHKVIWICKTIELADERFAYFKKNRQNVFLIHGKMKDKNDILENFDQGKNGILVATTVIEVGIDIDVSFIFIEEADMFGFAQLHQMRGRVGRREKEGYCILIGKNLHKLRQVQKAEDGFAITDLDLKKRGGGLIHGIEQSGFNSFKFAKTIENFKTIEIDISDEIISIAKKTKICTEISRVIGDFNEITLKI